MKLGFHAGDHFRRHELAIGVQDEQIARVVEDDAFARPVFVFIRPRDGAQGGIDSPVAAPVRPGFVMARAVGQTIAYGSAWSSGQPAASSRTSPSGVCATQNIPTCGVSR